MKNDKEITPEQIEFYIQNKDRIKTDKQNPFIQMNEDTNKINKSIQEGLSAKEIAEKYGIKFI